jgi:hypothetical protein
MTHSTHSKYPDRGSEALHMWKLYNGQVLVADNVLVLDFGPYGIIFMTRCVLTLDFPVILDGKFTSWI